MKEKVNYIYKITLLCGKLSGKYYLGKHTGFITDGYTGSGKIVIDYFKKYGRKKNKTYTKEIIEYNPTKEKNAERERIIIGDLWCSDPNCLNCCEGGSTGGLNITPWNKGKKGCFSESTLQKMSEAKKGKPSPFKGTHGRYTEETRQKISEAGKKRIVSEETRRKLSEKGKGHQVSTETRQKISKANKGRKWNVEARAKIMVPIIQYSIDNKYIKEWHGASEVEEILHISHKQIWKCLNGYRKDAGGYVWRYKERA